MGYESNIQQVVLNLEKKLKTASQISGLQRNVATYLMASNLRRIHNDGKAVNGSPIGSYSTKPTLVGASSFTTKAAADKAFQKIIRQVSDWKTIKKGDKMYRLMVLQGGYMEIRNLEGKETAYVNLQRTGKLRLSWTMEQQGADWVIGFNSTYGSEIANAQEKRFGKQIWGVSETDKQQIVLIEEDFIKKALNA